MVRRNAIVWAALTDPGETRNKLAAESDRDAERAMLMVFRDVFGEVPFCNSHGKGFPERDEFNYFTRSRIKQILEEIG